MTGGPGASWTCGTGRHRFDQSTVRGRRIRGQTDGVRGSRGAVVCERDQNLWIAG
jgi:hypothetical protein